jgi:hypothetical protein
VLTYNRTLRGYMQALTEENFEGDVYLHVSTCGDWSRKLLGAPTLAGHVKIVELGHHSGYPERKC